MKKIAFILLLSMSLLSDVIEVKKFESDLFSKDGNRLKKIEFSLLFDGRDLKENRFKVIDALNIIISSFYIEDLFTSTGKERFKTVLIKYLSKKYSVDVDDIFIQKFKIKNSGVSVDEFIDALKKEGFCRQKSTISKNFDEIDLR